MLVILNRTSVLKKLTVILMFSLTGCFISMNSLAVEFNTHFIDADDRNNVDLSRFEVANYIAPGEYLLDVVLNGRILPDQSLIKYIPTPDNKNSRICLTPTLVDKLDLTDSTRKLLTTMNEESCTSLDTLKEMTVTYDQK